MNGKTILAVLVLIITLVAGVGITSFVCDFQQIRDGDYALITQIANEAKSVPVERLC